MAVEGAPGMPHPADPSVSQTERRLMLLERHVSALRQNSKLRRSLDVAVEHDSWLNETITTTLTDFATATLARPEWATRALIVATLGLQMSNSSGSGVNVFGSIEILGVDTATLEVTVADGTTDAFSVHKAWDLPELTDDITVNAAASVNVGTNVSNYGQLTALVIWLP
jgi:hypothetical protein